MSEPVLSGPQYAALEVLLSGGTYLEAAQAAGVTDRHLRRWRASGPFAEALHALQQDVLVEARDRLAGHLAGSLDTVCQLRDDPAVPPAVRLRAAERILDLAGVQAPGAIHAPYGPVTIHWPTGF